MAVLRLSSSMSETVRKTSGSIASRPGDSQTLILSDGRTLGYAEYGSPTGETLYWIHGAPDSRKSPVFHHEAAKRHNIRLIGIDRPGMGLSSPKPSRTVLEWPDDLKALTKHLQTPTFRILAISGGTSYALACAKVFPSTELKSVGLIACIGPWEAGTKGCSLGGRIVWNLAAYLPGLYRWFWRRYFVPPAQNPDPTDMENLVRQQLKYASKYERSLSLKDDVFPHLVEGSRQAFRQGEDGYMEDFRLMTSDWGFTCEDVGYENIRLWYGVTDTNTPPEMGKYMAARLPKAQYREFEDENHFTLDFAHADEIFEDILRED